GRDRGARRILGSKPVLPSFQASRRHHAETIPHVRKNRTGGRKSLQEAGPRASQHSVRIGTRVARASPMRGPVGPTGSPRRGTLSPRALLRRERVVLGTGSARAPGRRAGVAGGVGPPTSSFTLRGVDEMETEGTLSSAWDQHLASEFAAKSADQALATMTAEP